jgi:two-component system alkaline phosphatase synthesis response regulator PhoP
MKSVLIIDDSPLILAAASAGLRGRFDVATAESGAEGVRTAVTRRPDAILLDVEMPDLNGAATLRALRNRAETWDVPVVFLTAGEAPAAAAGAGHTGVIAKPFVPADLADRVDEVLGWG